MVNQQDLQIMRRSRLSKKQHIDFVKAMEALKNGKDIKIKKTKKRKKETKPRNMEEKRIEREIILNLNIMGYTAIKAGESSMYNTKYNINGMSDIMVFAKSYGVVFVEVKTKKGIQSHAQKKFEKLCKECGLDYFIVRSLKDTLDCLHSLLPNHSNQNPQHYSNHSEKKSSGALAYSQENGYGVEDEGI